MFGFLLGVAFAGPWLAVLDIEGSAPEELRTLIADEIRGGGLQVEDLDVVTRENLLVLLDEMGDQEVCLTGACEVEVGRLIGADYVISGRLSQIESTWVLSVKLHESDNGKLLAVEKLMVPSKLDLVSQAKQLTASLFVDSLQTSLRKSDVFDYQTVLLKPPEKTLSGHVIRNRFHMGVHEVTQQQYVAVVGGVSDCEKCPVHGLSFVEVAQFANAVSEHQGVAPCYRITKAGEVYWDDQQTCSGWRLPTESEWLFAAKGGEGFPYSGSGNVDAVAWYAVNSYGKVHPVGQKKANGFGLHDFSGNVWEWVWSDDSVHLGYGILRGGSIQGSVKLTAKKRAPNHSKDLLQGVRLVRTANQY